ncbi:hypothetical protein [Kutzneria sp. 744]|uniref:hypothetical protein n=1 Tax=Kutzneria sp. (strain 744) TaxID=345341 RepID=UPI0003EEAC43|nr:hypothetical protein [Kutzneria sp. 744]EWM18213.1 hypothetical protein KUTG_08517 [Kutzneria sp. 744]
MRLRGYRSGDADLLSGPWLPGELLGLPVADWPPLAPPTTVAPPADPSQELCIAPRHRLRAVHLVGLGPPAAPGSSSASTASSGWTWY